MRASTSATLAREMVRMDSLDGVSEAEVEVTIRLKGAAKGINPFLTAVRVIAAVLGAGRKRKDKPPPTGATSPEQQG